MSTTAYDHLRERTRPIDHDDLAQRDHAIVNLSSLVSDLCAYLIRESHQQEGAKDDRDYLHTLQHEALAIIRQVEES